MNSSQSPDFFLKQLNDEEITSLCKNHFPSVYKKFENRTSLEQKIELLVRYCNRYKKVDKLHSLLQHDFPDQFTLYPSNQPTKLSGEITSGKKEEETDAPQSLKSKTKNRENGKKTRGRKASKKKEGIGGVKGLSFEIIASLIGVVLLSAGTIIVRNLFPGLTGDYLQMIAAFAVLVIYIFVVLFRREFQATPRKRGYVISSVAILLFLAGLALFLVSDFRQQRTVYFLIDASDNMQGYLDQVGPRVSLAIDSAAFPDNIELGLSVYGGNLKGPAGCEDVTKLVDPSPKEESVQEIIRKIGNLSQITPSGMAGLQYAIVDLFSTLKDRRGLQQIFVITFGPDHRCGTINRAILDKLAGDFGVKYELRIISLGEISEEDKKALMQLADVYQHVGLDQLGISVEEVLTIPPQVYKLIYPSR